MPGEIAYKLTADEKQATDAVLKLVSALAGGEAGMKKMTEESRRAAQEQAEMGRIAKRAMEDAKTPLDRYNEQVGKLKQLFDEGKLSVEAYEKATKKAHDEMESAGKAGVEAFGSRALDMVKMFAGALGIGTGVAGALHLVVEEFEAVHKAQQRALETSLPVADAQRMARAAAGFGNIKEAEAFDKQIEEASLATGVESKNLYVDAAYAMKDRGMLSREQTTSAVKMGAELYPSDSEARRAFVKTTMGLEEATGWSGERAAGTLLVAQQQTGMNVPSMAPLINALPGQDPLKFIALAQGLGASSEKDPTKMMMGIFRGLASGVKTHSDAEAETEKKKIAEELSHEKEAAKESALHDPQYLRRFKELEIEKDRLPHGHKMSAEAQAEATQRRRELEHEQQTALKDAEERARTTPAYQAKVSELERREKGLKDRKSLGESFDEQVAYVRAHPQIVGELIEGMGLRGKLLQENVRQYLTGTGAASEHVEHAYRNLHGISDKEAKAAITQQKEIYGTSELQKTAEFSRSIKVGKEHLEFSPEMQPKARIAVIMKEYQDIMEDVDEGALVSKLKNVGIRAGNDEIRDVRESLENKQKELRGTHYEWHSEPGGMAGSYAVRDSRGATEVEIKQADSLAPLIEALKKVEDAVKDNTANRDKNAKTRPADDSHTGYRSTLGSHRGDPGDRH